MRSLKINDVGMIELPQTRKQKISNFLHSIRFRLSLWFVIVLAVIMLIFRPEFELTPSSLKDENASRPRSVGPVPHGPNREGVRTRDEGTLSSRSTTSQLVARGGLRGLTQFDDRQLPSSLVEADDELTSPVTS